MNIYHPLLNITLPTVTDLKERCSNDEARTILYTACLLAAYRRSCIKKMKATYSDYDPDGYTPFKKYGQGHQWLSSQYTTYEDNYISLDDNNLNEVDIIRALLRHNPEFIEATLYKSSDDASVHLASNKFFRDVQLWKEISIPECSTEMPTTLRTGWARRWALFFKEYSDCEIDLSMWLSSIIDYLPFSWHQPYSDGLITESESLNKLINMAVSNFANTRDPQTNLGLKVFFRVPPLYYDKHNLLEQANQLLSSKPQLFVVSDDICSRNNLVNAIASNSNYCYRFNALDSIKEYGGGYIGEEDINIEEGISKESAFVLKGNTFPESGWCLDPDSSFKKQASVALSFFRQLVNKPKDTQTRFVISLSNDDFRLLKTIFPKFNTCSVLNIPESNFQNIIAQTIVRLPLFLEFFNCHPHFYQILNFIYQLQKQFSDIPSALENRKKTVRYGSSIIWYARSFQRCYPGHVRYYRQIDPFTEDKLLESYFSLKEPMLGLPFDWGTNFYYYRNLKRISSKRLMKQTLDRAKPFFVANIGNFDHLGELIRLYTISESLSDRNVPEIDLSALDALSNELSS